MLRLPSGLIVDISANRSKYHALKKHHPGPQAKHQDLYPLIDIIIRQQNTSNHIKRGWTEYDYDYSGYTLADISQLKNWNNDDKQCLRNWIKQKEQQQRIETARRRLVPEQSQLSTKLNSSPEYLFSLLKSRIKKLPLEKANPQQWLSTIYNMQQTGIRHEEIDWSGIARFLKEQPEKIILTKQQILNNINFDNIRLELSNERIVSKNGGLAFTEVAKQMPHQAIYRAALKLDENCLCILRYSDGTFNYRVGLVKTLDNNHHMALNKYWFALDPYGRAITNPNTSSLFFGSSETAMAACNTHSHETMGMRTGTRFNTHYDHITLYGGENYREWIISLPDFQRTFFGAHYFDHNVLVHIRTTTRLDNKNENCYLLKKYKATGTSRDTGRDMTIVHGGKLPMPPLKRMAHAGHKTYAYSSRPEWF